MTNIFFKGFYKKSKKIKSAFHSEDRTKLVRLALFFYILLTIGSLELS